MTAKQNEPNMGQLPQGQGDTEIGRQYEGLKVEYTKIFNEFKDLKRKEAHD